MPNYRLPAFRQLALSLLLLVATLSAGGQVAFFTNETPAAMPPGIRHLIDTSTDRSLNRYHAISASLQPLEASIDLNYQNQMLWIRIPLEALKDSALRYLMIRNPHINYVGMWMLRGDTVIRSYPLTGDHEPFANRAFYHTDFVYPLPFHRGGVSLLLLVDKRNEMLHVPIHFLDDTGFASYNRKKNLLSGFMIGLSVFLFLFNLFLFIQMRERLYVLYGLYIFMGVFYMFSDYGYSYMFLFPDYPRLGDFTRPVALSLALPLFFLFCVELLNTKKHFPVQHRWLMHCFVGYLCIFLASIPFMPRGGNLRVILLLMLQCFQFVIVGWILLAAFLSLRKQFSYAPYIIAATLILLGTGTAYSFFIAGVLEDNFLTRNLMNMGFSGEVTIIAFVLSLRFKNYKEQTEKLIRQASLQQEQIFRTITDYQEKELQRISSLLHDSLGAHLSALRLKLESAGSANGQLAEAITGITDMSQELRVLAHNLSPALLQKKGLAGALQQQVDYINSTKRIHIQFEVIGSVDRIPFRYELLIYNIIQELIQNIIKHSQASEAIVQLLLDDGLASIFVEDNGKGCEIHKIKDGLGFTQIKQLVTFVKGHLQINAVVNAGCKVSIEFALLADERNNSHSYR